MILQPPDHNDKPMTDPIQPESLSDPQDAAAYWLTREQSGTMTEAERQRFYAWLEADVRHAKEYRRAQGIWNAVALVPADRLRALVQEPAEPQTPAPKSAYQPRRRMALGFGAVAVAGIAVGLAAPFYGAAPATYAANFTTNHGQSETASLPDGSVINLNTNTRLSVLYSKGQRTVQLDAGEAFFTVQHDADQAFVVQAGQTQVKVTGTRFAVRRESDAVQVVVESGSVQVRHGPWWAGSRSVALVAGQSAQHDGKGQWLVKEKAEVETALAWVKGRMIFRNTSLADAVAEVNRYAPQTIRLETPAIGRLRIAGVLSTSDTNAFLNLLPDIAPIQVRRLPDGSPVIAER